MSHQDAKIAKEKLFTEPSADTDRVAHAVIGAAIEVHSHLGPGHLEVMYERALVIELGARGIPFERQAARSVVYKGLEIGEVRLDLVVDELVVVELKAVESLSRYHFAQALSYLTLTGLELGLLINFDVPLLREGIRRIRPR